MSRPKLHRLITVPMHAPTDTIPDLKGLVSSVVAIPLEQYYAVHQADEQELAALIDELADWFCRDADPMFVAIPIIGFKAIQSLELAPGIVVRRTTDAEVNAMIQIGALNVAPRPVTGVPSGVDVDEAARWVVAMNHSRPRRFGTDVPNADEPDLALLEKAGSACLAALRILTPAQVRLGPTFYTSLLGYGYAGGMLRGYGPPTTFAWHNPATITSDNEVEFASISRQIFGAPASRRQGINRFANATTRLDLHDRLVDLVIALESLFSEDADSVSYKVSRRASAFLGSLRLPASTTYRFVKSSYSSRSAIVHGRLDPKFKSLAGQDCPPEEHVLTLDRLVAAIFRQILITFPSDPAFVTADKLIDAALDLRSELNTSIVKPTYDVRVVRDGENFATIPPADNAYWVRGESVEELVKRVADVMALWSQAPCGEDQIRITLDQ